MTTTTTTTTTTSVGHAGTASTPSVPSPIQAFLEDLRQRYAGHRAGQVASYIPELAKADPGAFGIAIATIDGHVYEVGDSRALFTIQSVSKPLVYGMALEDSGPERVARAIGVEPSGDAFNSISLEPGSGRPRNPMINAGAIAAASLVRGDSAAARLQRVLDTLSTYAGRPLDIDAAVFESERSTGHRNRAIGHMLRNYDILSADPEAALELYFQQCAVRVDCRDLALMAATLANGGVHPVSGQRAVASAHTSAMLSVMTTCGMYDFSGEWAYRIGLPAKSGVGGGLMAVLPGQLGISVYSPALDERGNSVRGVQVCEELSRELGLHFLQPPRAAASTLRARYSLAALGSKRHRPAAEAAVLQSQGHRVAVFELQGDLRFSTLEPVVRAVVAADPSLLAAVLDFKRVHHVDAAALRLIEGLVDACAARQQQVVLTRVRRGDLLAGIGSGLNPRSARALHFQPQLDLGLEFCERLLLRAVGLVASAPPAKPLAALSLAQGSPGAAALAEHRLCEGLTAAEIEALARRLVPCSFEAGVSIVRRGDPADGLFLLLAGEASVVLDLPGGGTKRLSTLSAGMAFGELSLLDGGVRSADVRADTPVVCARLDTAVFQAMEREQPVLMIRLLQNLLRGLGQTTVRLTAEVAALEA